MARPPSQDMKGNKYGFGVPLSLFLGRTFISGFGSREGASPRTLPDGPMYTTQQV